MLDEHRRKIKNEEIYSSSSASHCWSCNYYFDFIKACIVSSPISTSHLSFYEVSTFWKMLSISLMTYLCTFYLWRLEIACLNLSYCFYSFIHLSFYLYFYLFILCFYSLLFFLFFHSFFFHFFHNLNLIICCNRNFSRVFLLN